MTHAREHWWPIERVAAIFGVPVSAIELAIAYGWVTAYPDHRGTTCCDPLTVEGLRRRLARVAEADGALDPGEPERVRAALEGGARDRMRALSDGKSYSKFPTAPPPPEGFPVETDPSLKVFVQGFLRRAVPGDERD